MWAMLKRWRTDRESQAVSSTSLQASRKRIIEIAAQVDVKQEIPA